MLVGTFKSLRCLIYRSLIQSKTVITTFTRDHQTRWKTPEVLKKPNMKRWLLIFCKHLNTLKRSRPSKAQQKKDKDKSIYNALSEFAQAINVDNKSFDTERE